MRTRLFLALAAVILLLALPGCSPAQAPEAPPPAMPPAPGNEQAPATVTVQRVQIDHNTRKITFSGGSTLADGACLRTRLLRDEQPLTWWPADACVKVTGGAWEITVALPEEGAADALQPDYDYELRAGEAGAAGGEATFWFDLSGPRNPER